MNAMNAKMTRSYALFTFGEFDQEPTATRKIELFDRKRIVSLATCWNHALALTGSL
jgi:hypothetical protein